MGEADAGPNRPVSPAHRPGAARRDGHRLEARPARLDTGPQQIPDQRPPRLANGAEPTLSWENDKPTVVALREIAAGNITVEMLREPEPPPVENTMTLDEAAQSSFRAPQFGLGD